MEHVGPQTERAEDQSAEPYQCIVKRGDRDRSAIGFAEKVLELLDEGRYTATYKYALLLALMDVCLEHTLSFGHRRRC